MIGALVTMVTWRWSARRIQRYLDSDPAAALDRGDIMRLEAHLAECQRCTTVAADYRQIDSALSRWAARRMPDPQSVTHMQEVLDRLVRDQVP